MDDVYTAENLKVMDSMERPHRPWRLKYEGTWPNDDVEDLPNFHREIDDIFETMPELPSLTIYFEGGRSVVALRDFRWNPRESIDLSIRRVFHEHGSVLGISFPAHLNRPEHTATRQEPNWSPYGKASAAILGRLKRGEIGAEEAVDRLKELSAPKDNPDAFTAVRLWELRAEKP
jgi:hypothetical protein